jgi:hypothetical protein
MIALAGCLRLTAGSRGSLAILARANWELSGNGNRGLEL